jgi:hypothetical protein
MELEPNNNLTTEEDYNTNIYTIWLKPKQYQHLAYTKTNPRKVIRVFIVKITSQKRRIKDKEDNESSRIKNK